ncbi:synaptobrevin protein [Cardiosporidium cionae]|uniref:Synaptobrevin protein n=1 Tax=Cardiosporidium cionae TaxID=476202 RepID=A0ABQ7JE28_9APIC|nr:synaptobrevin protein [Cardiosporidium cionae]|eukprot:KAF8822277.1 synaptobrevin protein [Cardiosporidium cionae]
MRIAETTEFRDKKSYKCGTIYLLADYDMCCLYSMIINTPDFSDRQAFSFLEEVLSMVEVKESRLSLNSMEKGRLSAVLKAPVRSLIAKYERNDRFELTDEVQQKINSTKDIMHENVKRILESSATMESLEQKTQVLSGNSSQFLYSSTNVRRSLWWRKMKVTILICTVGTALLLYLLLFLWA